MSVVAVGFFTVSKYEASSPGCTVCAGGLRPRSWSLVADTGGKARGPEPSAVLNDTLPPRATRTPWPGARPVTVEHQVIVAVPGFSHCTVSNPEPFVMLVGGTLNDAGSYATV